MSGDATLYEDDFSITGVDNSKYDRVSRLTCVSHDTVTKMTVDINTELYPVLTGENLHVTLASTLSLDGTKDDSKGWRDVGRGEATLADMYDYVMHGKVYKFEEADGDNM